MLGQRVVAAKGFAFVLALVGGATGATILLCFPPRHPDDWYWGLAVVGGGLAATGLLLGVLASLWLRRRVNGLFVVSALLIPAGFLGWFMFAKGGQSQIADGFALACIVSCIVFAGAAALLTGQRTRPRKGDFP